VMKEVDENGYKYLGVLQSEKVMNKEMKGKISKEYMRRVKLLGKSELYAGNLVKGINAWAIGVVRYSAGILDWTQGELRQLDVQTRKTLTICGAFHKRGSVGRLYLKRKDGGRGLISVEDCVRMEQKSLCEYVGKSEEWMLKVVADLGVVSEVETLEHYRKRVIDERKASLEAKPLHGMFFRNVKDVADVRSWQWLGGGYVSKAIEGFVFAAQEQAIRTRWAKATIDGEAVDPNCRVCGKKAETVSHIVSDCGELAKKQYKVRHDKMGLRVHWELCRKYGIDVCER